MPEPFCAFDTGAYFVLIATAPLQFAFSFGIIQAVMAVAIFFFISVGDPKHLLSQTQKFNKVFLRKNEKRAVFLREKLSENRPEIAFTSPIPRSRSKSAFGIFLFLLKIEF